MKSPAFIALAITGGNILGPLVIFGGIGYALTKLYDSNIYVLVGIGIAFVISNVLIVTNTQKYLRLRK